MGKLLVMLFAIQCHLPRPVTNPAPGLAHLPIMKLQQLDYFLDSSELCTATLHQVPSPSLIYLDYFAAI